ncbi:MAG TPA: peptidase, partial [Nitrospira sp.]|nr:peptidase [Nitrospira sp.]
MSDRTVPEQDEPNDRSEETSPKTGTDPLELIEQCLASLPEGDARQKLLYKLRHAVTLSQAAHQQRELEFKKVSEVV